MMYSNNVFFVRFRTVILMVLSCALALTAGAQKKREADGYVIKGKIKGLDCKKVVLITVHSSKDIETDSADVKKGSFKFTGSVPYPRIVVIKSDDEVVSGMFYIENSHITITGTMQAPRDLTFTGSVSHDEYMKLEASTRPLLDSSSALYKTVRELTKVNKDSANQFAERMIRPVHDEINRRRFVFIKENPQSFVSLFTLAQVYRLPEPLELKEMYDNMAAVIRESKPGQELGDLVKTRVVTREGVAAPPFTQNDTDGDPVSLASFKGSYVLIDFWASWCAPCRKENPNLVKAYEAFKDKGLEIIGVSLDEHKDRWLKAIEKDGLPWVHVSDLQGWKNAVALQYGVNAVPANFLVDPEGNIIASDLRGEKLEEALHEILP